MLDMNRGNCCKSISRTRYCCDQQSRTVKFRFFVCPGLSCLSTMSGTAHPTWLTQVQRLDTRFRELQRRGNEIAGDSSRPELPQVGIRGEKGTGRCAGRSTCQLRRPMKEKDASEYLRELETFHAEQDCFSINSNSPHRSHIS